MSKHVSIGLSNGKKYVRILESYRGADHKPHSVHIESRGLLSDLLKKDPNYVENLRKELREENRKEREAKLLALDTRRLERVQKLDEILQGKPDYGFAKTFNIGSALLREVWVNDLNMPQVFRYLQKKSKIEYSYDEAAFLLCSQRILRPASKKKTFEMRDSDIIPFSIDDINVFYRVLDRLSEDKHNIIRHINREISKRIKRKITVAFYDVTTYAFESRRADELKDFGLSKDHKVNEVQVVLGLVMDENGIPIDYDLFPGNTSEFGTLLPMIKRVKKDYGIKKLTVVADRGLNSNENLVGLKKIGCDFVIAQKLRNCSDEQKALVLSDTEWENTVDENGEILYKFKKIDVTKSIFETHINPETGKKSQSSKPTGTLDVQWVVSYSQARAKNDIDELERSIEKAKKAIQTRSSLTTSRGYRALIKTPKKAGKLELNEEKIAEARRWAGYYAVCTNLENKTSKEIMKMYRNLWRIEDCFRVSKTTLEARPCFVWTEEHIKGHFMSCFISLVIEKYLRYVLKKKIDGITNDEINEALRTANVAYDNGDPTTPIYLRLYSPEGRFDDMLRAFSLEPPQRYETAKSLKKKLKLQSIAPN